MDHPNRIPRTAHAPDPERIEAARELIASCDRILVGAGAGLSTAAGLSYSGERFQRNFQPFIRRYGMTDMYSAGFYPFPTEEDRWAYWARHVWVNRHEPPALPLYVQLREALRDKDCFVITTNVDAQFEKAGFPRERLFATQGDYGLNQCARGCHDTLYPNRQLAEKMLASAEGDGTRIPSQLVPRCPVCGGRMNVHLRIDGSFVENADWHAAEERYRAFVAGMREHPTLLLELGVGWNTPVIIRMPFDRLAVALDAPLVRINYDDARVPKETAHAVALQGDIAEIWPLITP
ncbi:SIR2 family NAD-dependent protein deacylase [Arabiibacter massiliensis]|uniref:SIR2 family NAD-dependent protein deacylase n=1 Tax=Arabiibacter massiliensis TaxID=1870985 RepID=UPI0018DA18DD|nr:Sir2 silent information regulator family NAD-dependent deacetylase [Arabiibacter massiliensis]